MKNRLCKRCNTDFRKEDSTGSDFDLCQDCWEVEADKKWWEFWK